MGKIINLSLFVLIIIVTSFYIIQNYQTQEEKLEQVNHSEIKSKIVKKELPFNIDDGLFSYMYEHIEAIESILGEPHRKDLTPYGYTWWVYKQEDQYIQFGVENNKIVTIFATGEEINSNPITIGQSYDEIKEAFPFTEKVTYKKGISHYTFLLNENDLFVQPLVMLTENLFVQFYFDTYTEKLTAIRMIDGELLTKQRFYEMEYRGNLPADEQLSQETWQQIEAGMAKQIFDLTNLYRTLAGLHEVQHDEKVAEVAYSHSKDMYDNNYFSHDSIDGRGLKDRLEQFGIFYLAAGENIAAQHLDAPAAVHGWLNSEGHRETLLNDQYNHLGVGVHRLYYTQNFLLKP